MCSLSALAPAVWRLLSPAPAEMRGSVWDMDWWEDPIWRNDRINAINLHFITAFLAVHLRGEGSRATYLNVPVETSDDGVWKAPVDTPWGAYSPGGDGVTLWKGFQRRHARGWNCGIWGWGLSDRLESGFHCLRLRTSAKRRLIAV
jgi:hypothetical protein